jgi:protease IV
MATPYSPKAGSGVGAFFRQLWQAIDFSRRLVLNVLFLLVLAIVVAIVVAPRGPTIKEKTALVMDLNGKVVEQSKRSIRDRVMGQAGSGSGDSMQLRDIVAALDAAAKDSRIDRVLLLTDELEGAGLASLREIAAAMERFKATNKPIVAWGSNYDQRSLFLAAHASEVLLHPFGIAMPMGFGRYRNYYKDAFERLGLTPNVLRVGTFKNAAEPYFANAPSPASIEAETYLFGGMWQSYTDAIEKARKLPPGTIGKAIETLPERFAKVNGDTAKLSLELKFVDALKTPDELRALLIERGAKDDEGKSFRQVSFSTYLNTIKPAAKGEGVGIIVAEGEIVDGTASAGRVGGKSTAALIRKARENDKIKAVVLRVNSPGGSAFASEMIRRELELTQKAGKPVVISMGDVAASGGYWIAMSADEIMADAATITGSIGVFAMLPTAEKAMEKISVNAAGTHTTWLAGAYDVRRGLDPRFAELVQVAIQKTYADFTGMAAKARKTTPDKIDAVGQGRVWTGAQAKERGLIDSLGGLREAVRSAATRGKLSEDARVIYVEGEVSTVERIMKSLGAEVAGWQQKLLGAVAVGAGIAPPVANAVQAELQWVTEMMSQRGPLNYHVMAHCFCATRE